MYSQAQKILVLLGIFSSAASAGKLRQKEHLLWPTARSYTQVPGNGWCTDAVGSSNENSARRFVEVDCNSAKNLCDSDSACVAYACMTGSSPMTVLYTTTNCSIGCDHTGWQNDPRLITRASYAYQPLWSTATCHVAYPGTMTTSTTMTTTTSTTMSTTTSMTTALHENSMNLCHGGFMNSSTAIYSANWIQHAATSREDCVSKCTGDCWAWKGNSSNWAFCYTASTLSRTIAAWPQGYTGGLRCAIVASCGAYVNSTTSLGDPEGGSGSPWILLPATSREHCAAQCLYDHTCVAYKGGDDTGCLLRPNERCEDFTCYVTASYANTSVGWETDGPDWVGAYRSACH